MSKQIREAIVAPRVKAPEIPKELDQLIVMALAKKPSDRFKNATEMRVAMEKLLESSKKRPIQMARIGALAMATVVMTTGLTFALKSASIPKATAAIPATEVPAAISSLVTAPLPSAAEATPPPFVAPALAVKPAEAASVQTESVVPRRATTKAAKAEAKRTLIQARVNAKARPLDIASLRTWAQAAYRAGDLKEARRAGDAWCKIDGSIAPRLLLASALDASGRSQKAREIIEEYAQTHPDSPEAKQALARVRSASAMTADAQR